MSQEKSGQNRENSSGGTSEICARLETIESRVAAACARAGRVANEVLLIGASKTVPADKLEAFLAAGLRHCGENYVQEGVGKIGVLRPAFPEVQWHFIGALQSNKAREVVSYFDWVHSVDRSSLANALDKAAREKNKIQNILLQVNLGAESTKSGCAIGDLSTLAALVEEKENLRLCGLMCLPPLDENPENTRAYFRELRRLRDEVLSTFTDESTPESTLHLSMGMSHDFEVAIEEGATMIRVGTALFGARR